MKLGEFSHRYWLGAVIFILASAPLIYLAAHGIISWLFALGILLAYAALLVVYVVRFGISLYKRRYVRAASILMGAIILALLATNWSSFIMQTRSIIDIVRFYLQRSHYLDVVEKNPIQETPKLIFFDWGGTGHFLSANVFYALVYDESDEVALPANLRTGAWNAGASKKSRVVTAYESRCQSEVAHLEGHFYVATTVCQ